MLLLFIPLFICCIVVLGEMNYEVEVLIVLSMNPYFLDSSCCGLAVVFEDLLPLKELIDLEVISIISEGFYCP